MKRCRLFCFLSLIMSLPVTTQSQGAPSQAQSIDERVATLIEEMLKERTEQRAFADLEALGCPAVPAIIQRMDDRRKLPDPHISLKNKSPDAFEAMRNYGPEKVVDALAAILNQVTGRHFGFIYSGGTDKQRTKAVQGWRNFLKNTPSTKLCSAGQTCQRIGLVIGNCLINGAIGIIPKPHLR